MEAGIILFIIVTIIILLGSIGLIIYSAVRNNDATGATGVPPNSPSFPNTAQPPSNSKFQPASTANAFIGSAIALSEDGNVLAVGLPGNNGNVGGVYVYGRSAGNWSLQSGLLLGTGNVGAASQGQALAMNSAGDRLVIGGPTDDSNIGAVWVFDRINGAWTQVGEKLVADDLTGGALFGSFVDIADEANYIVIGSPADDSNIGCCHVFTLEDDAWVQMTDKLVGSGAVGPARQGFSVQIGDEGGAVIVGGPLDAVGTGAAWVFTRADDTWSQLGSKLVPTGLVGAGQFGYSVAISGTEANTIAIGAPLDNGSIGAIFMFSVEDSVVTQQGSKIVPTGTTGLPLFGFSCALSDIGRTLFVGAPGNNSDEGIAFSFIRNELLVWQQVADLKGNGATSGAQQGYAVGLSSDGTTGISGARSDTQGRGAFFVYIYSF